MVCLDLSYIEYITEQDKGVQINQLLIINTIEVVE